MRSIYKVLPRSAVLIGQFEFKDNYCGYWISFSSIPALPVQSHVICIQYIAQQNDAQKRTFRSSKPAIVVHMEFWQHVNLSLTLFLFLVTTVGCLPNHHNNTYKKAVVSDHGCWDDKRPIARWLCCQT
jgi:hypothetical protein